jgi:hypothetical protein
MLLFRHHLLRNLPASGRIGQATLDILDRFHHPGFSAYEGEDLAAGHSAACNNDAPPASLRLRSLRPRRNRTTSAATANAPGLG